MEQAWLDSLSEDWISQPRSGSPAPSLPSLPSLSHSTPVSDSRPLSNQVPKHISPTFIVVGRDGNENSPLSERSLNERNIPLSLRLSRRPTKLRQVTSGSRGRHLSRTLSATSDQSVQHHTVQHKSHSLSPKKVTQDTPEWRRRLLNGDVAYGEQRDLFSAAGLESIFQPPATQLISKKSPIHILEGDSTMPSSPPPYEGRSIVKNSHDTDSAEKGRIIHKQPPGLRYKSTDSDNIASIKSISRTSSAQFLAKTAQAPYQELDESGIHGGFSSSFNEYQSGKVLPGRIVSGQSDIRNEELSPIYVARHSTENGSIDYAALDLPVDVLQQRLEEVQEANLVDSTDYQDEQDLTERTDDFANNGGFVNIRRGGLSHEGSFQRRMLSPSSLPAIDESVMLQEESIQASTPKQLPYFAKPRRSTEDKAAKPDNLLPVIPSTPFPSPQKSAVGSNVVSGSPLKLFGTYDTFTNTKLLRRLSQFEDGFVDRGNTHEPVPSVKEPTMNDMTATGLGPHEVRRISSFGRGELEDFKFSEEISYESTKSNTSEEDKENVSLPGTAFEVDKAFTFQLDSSALESNVVVHHKTKYITKTSTLRHTVNTRSTIRPGTSSSDLVANSSSPKITVEPNTPRKRYGDSESKRLPKSPLKYPTPKRRRTLHGSEMEQLGENGVNAEMESVNETHHKMQSVIGRKRKDARHDDNQKAANPKVLAMRQILRPRTPTPNQRSSQLQEPEPLQELKRTSIEDDKVAQETKIARIQAELDATVPLKVLALKAGQQMQNESRKGSVTTQDFLDEAKKIMAGIRGKARPRSGLTSLEESESDNDREFAAQEPSIPEGELDDSYQESTKEPFSRPPSREGAGPLPRLPKQQDDPALLDHLRKYQERSDLDGVVASSMKSIAMAKEAALAAKETDRLVQETISRSSARIFVDGSGNILTSDPPNIRISENPDANRKRKHSLSSTPNDMGAQYEDDFPSRGSNASSDQSTSRSIPTGSSRGSDSRRVIAPHTVSHLIPEQLAGMVFDRERNIWVKRKNHGVDRLGQDLLPSDETEEDPFGDIPDLSVDETKELQRLKAIATKLREEAHLSNEFSHHEYGEAEQVETRAKEGLLNRVEQYKKCTTALETSKLDSFKVTKRSTNSELHEVKAHTSNSRDEFAPSSRSALRGNMHEDLEMKQNKATEDVAEEVEREISILEDRIPRATPVRRNVTITFSSPIASIIEAPAYEDDVINDQGDADESGLSDDGEHDGSIYVRKGNGSQRLSLAKQRKVFRSSSKRVSFGGHNFSTRPVSRIDEQDENTIDENQQVATRNASLIVSTTTIPCRQHSLVLATPRPIHEVGTLTLTPLSDFTVNNMDESLGLDVSYVAQKQRYGLSQKPKRTLSLSIKELVEKITEVEPHEPFWEHIKHMELKDKRLTNLHKLEEFCEHLEELNVANNEISHLDGIPSTVRRLNIAHNQLSDLTAWSHLMNLQYVDISNNEIESLTALKSLVHMRSLRADNNMITSLDGINELDGLLSLRMRGNSIKALDFRGSKLFRLIDVDLQSNHISKVEGLHELDSLTTLDLTDNHLSEFSVLRSEKLPGLKYLRLSGNSIEFLDVAQYPNLRLLYLDGNRLGTITGLLKTKYLDSLSMREQQQGSVIDPEFLSEAFEVRKLFLSGNHLGVFEPQADFLNLQYLELASCGIESLPEDFAVMMSNVRVLNPNFNALNDISALAGISRLKKLHIAGNRFTAPKMVANVLSSLPNLTVADLRGNPLTIGFYPPVMENGMVVRDTPDESLSSQEPYVLAMANKAKDVRYFNCLDLPTQIRRRLLETYLVSTCLRLRVLDGLEVDPKDILSKRDRVFDELVKRGYLIRREKQQGRSVDGDEGAVEAEDKEEPAEKPSDESVWQAEDSFA